MITRMKAWLWPAQNALMHPKTTFRAALAGVIAITQSETDWDHLFGPAIGPRVYVVAKWLGAFCIAAAAEGRSVIPSIDNPKSEGEGNA